MRICLVEDDLELGHSVQALLQDGGHDVVWVRRLTEARYWLEQQQGFDALVLDLGLPDGNGLELLRLMRQTQKQLPIVVITARSGIEDRLHGLDSGADDYLVKPFQPEELAARIRALQRRALSQGAQRRRLNEEVEMDLAAKCVYRHSQRVDLTAREWTLLEALVARAGRVVSKSDLEALTQGFEGEAASNVLEVHVFNLRRKLGRSLIETVRGLGYRVSA